MSTLEHLTTQKSFTKTTTEKGLEQWHFNNRRGDLGLPSSIRFLDGIVIEIEGPHLVALDKKLVPTSEVNEILGCLQSLGLKNCTEEPNVLYFRNRCFEVIAIASRPNFKKFCVIDIEANERWKSRHRHGKLS